MGGGKKAKAPKAPDYASLAQQQAQSDMNVAQYTTQANRPNQYGPTGSSTWTMQSSPEYTAAKKNYDYWNSFVTGNGWTDDGMRRTDADINWARAYQLADAQKALSGMTDKQTWTQNITLTPEEQAIFNREQQNRLGMEGLAGTAIGAAGRTIGSEFSPQLRGFLDPQAYQMMGAAPGMEADRVGLAGNTLAGMADVNEATNQFQAQGDQVRDALYKQMTRFNSERFGEQSDTERNRLAQLGLQEGTQAYQNAIQEMRRSQTEAEQGSQLQSILAGGQEQSRLVADQLAARASNIGLRQGQFGQNMSRDQQDMAERLQMYNAAQNQWGQNQSDRQFQAGNQLNLANMAAQQRQQQFGEQSYMRSLPINEIGALLGGGGVQMPQFPGFSQATPYQGADLLGAAQAGYGAKMGAYNSGQQQKGSLLGAGAGLLGGYLGGK